MLGNVVWAAAPFLNMLMSTAVITAAAAFLPWLIAVAGEAPAQELCQTLIWLGKAHAHMGTTAVHSDSCWQFLCLPLSDAHIPLLLLCWMKSLPYSCLVPTRIFLSLPQWHQWGASCMETTTEGHLHAAGPHWHGQ